MGTPSPSGTARSTAMHHHPARAASMSRLGGTFRCSSRRRKAPTTRTSSATQGGDTLYEEGRHHHHHHHHPKERLRVSPTPPGGGNKNNRHKNSELIAIHDAVNDTKNAKDLRQSLHELSKHMASNGGPTLPADITTRRKKQERRAVLEHFIEKVDEKATVEDDI